MTTRGRLLEEVTSAYTWKTNYVKRGGGKFSAKSGGKRTRSVQGLLCKWFGKAGNLGDMMLES